jgi:hypothetical protein
LLSGAQTLAAACAACGEDLAAAGGGEAGAEAVTALAHQFAGLISPLHGSFSADRGQICLLNEIESAVAGPPKTGRFRPQLSRPGESRAIPTDNSRRLIRERPVFVNLGRGCRRAAPERRILREFVDLCGVFRVEDGGRMAPTLDEGNS